MRKLLLVLSIPIIVGVLLYAQQTSGIQRASNIETCMVYDREALIENFYNYTPALPTESIPLNLLKDKARMMSCIEWIPKSDVPYNSGYFRKDELVQGLPYSSVKELQRFIGLDVSIYTFLTAVNNPYSLLYTEDVAAGNPCYLGGTYNGKNSHTFYGTVCSSFTAFCFGEINNYASFNYKNGQLPHYTLKADQSIDAVSPGDLFWCPGHVALITEVDRNAGGTVVRIELIESAGKKVTTTKYTPTAFARRLGKSLNSKNQGYLYENKLLTKVAGDKEINLPSDSLSSILSDLRVDNKEICTWFGDKPCLGEWDKIMLNFTKKDYDRIFVFLNDVVVDTLDISKDNHSVEYHHRGRGIYKAHLASARGISPVSTSFEVLDTKTKMYDNTDGSMTTILFPDNSNPEIVYWVNRAGEQYTFPLIVSETAKKEGKMVIQAKPKPENILRVIYRGEYGRAINRPDHLFQE
ncbi:MAG: hypothetical protein HDS23_05165 [Bacteroides sp.]|nr:hypothetical protein [Bacteroides sp.]